MDASHIHTVLTPGDYSQARAYLHTRLGRMFLLDTAPFLILALLMAIALSITLEESNPNRIGVLIGLPGTLIVLAILRATIRCAFVAVRARKGFAQLEARTLAGEAITCAEIDEPFPIRPPAWLP